MACFIVPAAEAIIVSGVAAVLKKKEEKVLESQPVMLEGEKKITMSKKLNILSKLLWGGVVLLAFEHLWHGEVVPFPPFLTAMADPEETQIMLSEMASVGTSMAALVTAAWGAVCGVLSAKTHKKTAVKEG